MQKELCLQNTKKLNLLEKNIFSSNKLQKINKWIKDGLDQGESSWQRTWPTDKSVLLFSKFLFNLYEKYNMINDWDT